MAQSISQEAIGATGLPGATAASRHAGATASGAPTTGTFAVGDYVIDQTGKIYVCTVAGTPGTWVQTGGGVTPAVNPAPALNNLQAWNTDIVLAAAGVASNGVWAPIGNTINFTSFTPTTTISLTTSNKLWYATNGSGSGTLQLGIYSGNGTTAGTLLCSTASTSFSTNAYTGLPLTGSATLTAGTTYWFAHFTSTTSQGYIGFINNAAHNADNVGISPPSTTGGLAYRVSSLSQTSLQTPLTATPAPITGQVGFPWIGLS